MNSNVNISELVNWAVRLLKHFSHKDPSLKIKPLMLEMIQLRYSGAGFANQEKSLKLEQLKNLFDDNKITGIKDLIPAILDVEEVSYSQFDLDSLIEKLKNNGVSDTLIYGKITTLIEEAPVEPTPVEPTPVEPTLEELTSEEQTSVEQTSVEPISVEPISVEPTPIETDYQPSIKNKSSWLKKSVSVILPLIILLLLFQYIQNNSTKKDSTESNSNSDSTESNSNSDTPELAEVAKQKRLEEEAILLEISKQKETAAAELKRLNEQRLKAELEEKKRNTESELADLEEKRRLAELAEDRRVAEEAELVKIDEKKRKAQQELELLAKEKAEAQEELTSLARKQRQLEKEKAVTQPRSSNQNLVGLHRNKVREILGPPIKLTTANNQTIWYYSDVNIYISNANNVVLRVVPTN